MKRALLLIVCLSFSAFAGCSDDDDGGETGDACAVIAPSALATCVETYGTRLAECYTESNASCAENDGELNAALSELEAAVASCGDGEFGALDGSAVAGRLRNACESEASSVAWRTYGGPQGAVYEDANDEIRSCLVTIHEAAISMMGDSLRAINDCAEAGCDVSELESQRAAFEATAESVVASACSDLELRIGVEPSTYVARTARGVDCLTSAGHPDTGDIPTECGPSYVDFNPTRGQWSEVVVDSERWGTMCGDGSDYAFWIRPAPEGSRLDRVIVALQGGGVCLFEEDCEARLQSAPGLFSARDEDDMPLDVGIASTDPEVSPFSDWTIVYLPYCNQDVFAGGGVTEELGEVEIPRYGSVNLRSSVRMVRDYIWKEMDAAGGDGFRPDEVVALFGGFSAGGYGTIYNYHWFLDDLLWPRTTAFPDAGLAIDNGEVLGVGNLGAVKIPAWGLRPFLPPYCFRGSCSGGETLLNALSPRLETVPQQRVLMLSNQLDSTQARDAFFTLEEGGIDDAGFINAMRQMFCDTRDLPGVNWYLTSVSDMSVHVVTIRENLWLGEVAGEVMADFFEDAVTDPMALGHFVEEGDFMTAVPGVNAFPCELNE